MSGRLRRLLRAARERLGDPAGALRAGPAPRPVADGILGGVEAALVIERRRHTVFLRAIEAIGHSLTSSLDLDDALDTIAGRALEVMSAEAAVVVSWDGQAPELRVMRAVGRLSREYAAGGVIPVDGGPVSRAVLESRAITTPNLLAEPVFWLGPERRAQIEREGYRAVGAAPLVSKGRVHGALVVHYWHERKFTDEDKSVLMVLARHAALAIDGARLHAEATRRADRLRELAEVERLVTSSLDLQEVLTRIAESTARLVGAPMVRVWTVEPSARVLRASALSLAPGIPPTGIPTTLAFGEGIAGRVAESRAPIFVPDVTRDPRVIAVPWSVATGLTTLLVVPIVAGESLLGVLTVTGRAGTLASEEDQALVGSLAALAAAAVQNARLYAQAVRRAGRLHDLVEVSQSITASLDTADVMQRIAQAAAAMRPGALAAVHVFDADHDTLQYAATSGPEMAELPRARPATEGLPGLVVERRLPVLIADPPSHPRTFAPQWWRRRLGASYYGVPISVGDTFVGVLDYILSAGLPEREEQEALQLLAAQAGVAVRNARLYREAQQDRDVAEALARLGGELASTLDVDRIAAVVARGLVELLNGTNSVVYRYEAEDRSLRALASFGPDSGELEALVLPRGEGVAGRAVDERRMIITRDILHDPMIRLSEALRARFERVPDRAVVGLPLLAQDQVIGALALAAVADREFTPEDLQALRAFADQAALALAHARLYAAARDSLQRLRETQAQLVQAGKLTALGQLVSGVAHELNNPLSVIIGYGQLLSASDLPEKIRQPVDMIVTQGDRMAKIVRSLLYFARQRPPEHAPLDLHQVIEETLALRLGQLGLSGVVVERDFASNLPLITGDPQQLQQVFLNLLLNAEQAIAGAPEAGGRIVLRTRLTDGGRVVRVAVIDDGPGISPDVLPRVFEPFFTTKEVGAGTGLGLSVSYGIAVEHRGRLTVESEPGRTEFTLELPVDPPSAAARASTPLESPPVGAGRLALVVEDEPSVLDFVVALLMETGWRVDTAGGGRAALEMVRHTRYELIVSDVRMPDGGGEELYRAVVGHDDSLARRFIFITGDTANPVAWEFLQRAKVPVLEKPFLPTAFLDAVRRVAAPAPPGA